MYSTYIICMFVTDQYSDHITLVATEGATIEVKTALLAIVLPVVLVVILVVLVIVLVCCCCPGVCARCPAACTCCPRQAAAANQPADPVYDVVGQGQTYDQVRIDPAGPEPVVYSQARLVRDQGYDQRTARKISSTVSVDLQDRIRKSSGIGRETKFY